MLSPAQPSPSAQPGRGKKCIIFRFFFRQRYSRTVKSCCSKIEKNFLDPPDFQWKSMFFDDFSSQIERQKINTPVLQWLPRRDLRPGYLMIFSCFSRASWPIARPACWFFDAQFGWKIMLFSRVFRVLSDPLRDRGVDFLTVNIDEKSCYFRVFFACFLTDCKTGVLIFSCYAERRVLVHYELPETF